MDWTQVITIVGSNLALFLWARTESRSDYRECRQLIDAIHKEMKEFHGRLERQDAEFKGRLALQDQEYKNHLLQYHQNKN
jgi:hypothetical protein